MVDKYELQMGENRKIVVVKKQKNLKFKKGQKLIVIGQKAQIPEPEEGERPLKVKGHVRAQRVDATHKRIPSKELAAIIGL